MLDHRLNALRQYLGQIPTHLRRHHEYHAVVTICTERQTHIVSLQFGFPLDPMPTHKVERSITQHLAIAPAMKRLHQSHTRILRHHLNIIHTILSLADGHLGTQRNSLILVHNQANL